METPEKNTRMHLGRKISRIRELRGMKQEALANELGISQQAISKLEQSEDIEDSTLDKVAQALGVTAEAIKNYSDEAVINNIQNNYDSSVVNSGPTVNNNCTFNPLDKLLEALEGNKQLYERLLASEREKIDILKKS
ncbi:helix-turn-helix transcriptional regulator [Pedobacter aquatilis]|uniref:helix-turn-helix domain-containing protein n=1 Tax=Pedobacter aquatilis TaxID=351343 RepID=UPI0025B57D0C|nr:helix-turn-helix transcriptional regulator [Pedobacter aquatilis]MDN3585682.1 helix-turn-helix transcriptional regulator [Pedobacter aquatilis]